MNYEVFRDLIKVLLALAMVVAMWRGVYYYKVSDNERRDIQREATSKAHGAWSAVRESDLATFKQQLDDKDFQIAARDAVIADQAKELKRLRAIAKAFATGKGGRIQ